MLVLVQPIIRGYSVSKANREYLDEVPGNNIVWKDIVHGIDLRSTVHFENM